MPRDPNHSVSKLARLLYTIDKTLKELAKYCMSATEDRALLERHWQLYVQGATESISAVVV